MDNAGETPPAKPPEEAYRNRESGSASSLTRAMPQAGQSSASGRESETIVALSTPPGTSGLGVIRLSGPACRAVAADCLGRPDPSPRHVYYGAFRGEGEVLDRLNFVFFPGPASSTGEDVLELYPHGN